MPAIPLSRDEVSVWSVSTRHVPVGVRHGGISWSQGDITGGGGGAYSNHTIKRSGDVTTFESGGAGMGLTCLTYLRLRCEQTL